VHHISWDFFPCCSIVAILYDGRLEERKALREELTGEGRFSVLITHYDLIMRDKAFLKKIHWHYLIIDEGHRLKNHECALARTLVSGYVRCNFLSVKLLMYRNVNQKGEE